MLSEKQVRKAIDIDLSQNELTVITNSLNELLGIVIASVKNFPENKRVIPIQDLNDFVTMIFRNTRNIPHGFRRKTVNRITRVVKRIMHNAVINFTFLKRFIEDPIVAIKEFHLEEIQ